MSLDAMQAGLKRGLVAFLVVDAIFIAGAVAAYVLYVRPQIAVVEVARDAAVRANLAMTTRVRAVEARLALATGDRAGAQVAAADVQAQLTALAMRIPRADTLEAAGVTSLRARAALVADEISRDPAAARRDLEFLEAQLAVLYPAR